MVDAEVRGEAVSRSKDKVIGGLPGNNEEKRNRRYKPEIEKGVIYVG